jgi:hypothetical protein
VEMTHQCLHLVERHTDTPCEVRTRGRGQHASIECDNRLSMHGSGRSPPSPRSAQARQSAHLQGLKAMGGRGPGVQDKLLFHRQAQAKVGVPRLIQAELGDVTLGHVEVVCGHTGGSKEGQLAVCVRGGHADTREGLQWVPSTHEWAVGTGPEYSAHATPFSRNNKSNRRRRGGVLHNDTQRGHTVTPAQTHNNMHHTAARTTQGDNVVSAPHGTELIHWSATKLHVRTPGGPVKLEDNTEKHTQGRQHHRPRLEGGSKTSTTPIGSVYRYSLSCWWHGM